MTTESDRPEYIKCIQSQEDSRKTACGRWKNFEFVYRDLEHAELSIKLQDRIIPCEACLMLRDKK